MMDVDTLFPRGSRQCRGALEFVVDDFCRKFRVNVVASLLLLSLSVVGCLRKVRNPGRNEVYVQIWCSSETGTELEPE